MPKIIMAGALWMLPVSLCAQWLNYREPGVPRLKDGKVNLSAPTPRTADHKPDLTGVWMHEPTPTTELKRIYQGVLDAEFDTLPPGMNIELQNKYGFDILIDFDSELFKNFKPGQPPPSVLPLMRPESTAIMLRRNAEGQTKAANPSCGAENAGWPLAGMLSEPIKIVQGPKETMVLYEVGDMHRQIFTDGRQFPAEFNLPAYLGYSIGRWEGETFVVESRGFNGKAPIDGIGHPRSEGMHVIERFRRRDFGHLDYEITFDDPTYYTQKFTVRIPHELVPDNDIFEMFCENEKDAAHIKR